jgi:anti-sigma-K factor RskA
MSTDIHTLAGAYALDAVSDIERAAFDRHLRDCPSCAQELAEFRATLERITDLTQAPPPARLKQAVLAETARTRQVPPDARAAGRSRSKPWRTWAVGAAAAALIAVAGGVVGYAVSDQNTRSAQAQIEATARQDAQISAIMGAPDATTHYQAIPGGGRVRVVVSPTLDRGVAVVSDMPEAPTGKTYQLWLFHGVNAANAGVMPPGSTGGTVVLEDVRGADSFGMSLEADGGSTTGRPTQVVSTFQI